MKKRILSVICSLNVLCGMILSVSVNAVAEDVNDTQVAVDGSVLTQDGYSKGTSYNPMLRGKHLMTGDSIVSKAGKGKVYVYGQTTANHDVDYVAVLMYLDELNKDKKWEQIDFYLEEIENTYYVIVDDTRKVKGGTYYRVHSEHFAGNKDEEMYDSAISATDGIWIPAP